MKKSILIIMAIGMLVGQVDYGSQIQTIIDANCTNSGCHTNGGGYQNGLDLSSYNNLMTGDSENGPVVVPLDHANSLLWQKVNTGAMPPGNNPDLSGDEVNLIASWIDEGALETPAVDVTGLFFSEYAEGSEGSNKYVEIYNGTGSSVDLSDYQVWGSNNGGGWIPNRQHSLAGTLSDGDVYVLAADAAVQAILDETDLALAYESALHYNGDDAIGLAKDNGTGTFELIDVIGVSDVDPGSGWDVAGTTNGTKDHTLIRKSTVTAGNADWSASAGTDTDDSEWLVDLPPTNTYTPTTLGWHINVPCAANSLTVNMYDSYGDGWGGGLLTIGANSFTVEADSATATLCLEDGSYIVTFDGGTYLSEISWEILNAAGEVLLAGGAPYADVLQLGETTDVLGCTDADALNYDENATLDDGSCYFTGDSCHISIQAVAGTNDASGENQWFTYTTTMDGILTISSQNATGDAVWDTFLAVYADDCQTDVANNDDCCDYYGPSTVEIAMVAGTTYKLLWLGWYTPGPFPFTIEESPPPSSPENLTATAGVGSVNLAWDGIMPTANSRTSARVAKKVLSPAQVEAKNQAKMLQAKGEEPAEVHRFAVVHPDYAPNSRSTDVIITVDGGTWQSEVSWEIIDATGTIVAFGGAPIEVTVSMDDGEYVVMGYDSYGDGWNGNILTATDAASGTALVTLTIEEGDFASATLIIGDAVPELANLSMSNAHYDAVTDAVMLTIHNTGGSIAHGFYVTYYESNATSGECLNDLWDDWDLIDYLEPDSSVTYAVIEEASYWMGYGTYDIGAFIDWGCTVPESDETNNTITTTIDIPNPFEGVTWNVYRSDAGAEFASVGVTDSMGYLDDGLTGEVEYCYYITQVDIEGAAESDTSYHACATPIAPVDLPNPTSFMGAADGWDVALNWVAPSTGGGDPLVSEDFEDGTLGVLMDDTGEWMVSATGPAPESSTYAWIDDDATGDGAVATDATLWTADLAVEIPANFTLNFNVYYPQSGGDCASGGSWSDDAFVWAAIDGGAPTLVETIPANGAWNNLSVSLGYATTSVKAGIQYTDCGGNWAYYIAVDDVTISPSADFLLQSYNVYRDSVVVGTVPNNAVSWNEFIAEEGDYAYYATAVYDTYGESDGSNSDTVTVTAPAPTCDAPQNLMAESLGNDVSLSWDAPEGGAGWFGYNDGVIVTSIGTNAAAEFSVAVRFGQEELADYNGMALSRVRFAHNEPTASYQVVIWTAEAGGSPVLLDTTDWMAGSEIPALEFYEVELDESITIDWSQELWIGYNIDTPAGFPAGCDGGPAVTGYGDLLSFGGEFVSMNAAYGLNYNWMIDGFADYADGRSIASMAPINIEYSAPANTNEPEEHRLPTPIVINTPGERNMTNYIVYRDGEAEDTLDIGETMYSDMDVEWGDHNYFVTALYNNSEECGESEPSNTVDVSLYNNPPPAVMLLQPDDGATIAVTESNSGDDFPFIWTAVNDDDNDPVMYVVSATDEDGSMSDTSMAVAGWFPTIGELAAPLLEDSVAVMTFSWNVYASDPWDSTASLNGPRTLTIDVSGLLALDGIGLPDVFALHNNYPNPFNPVTNITYDIPEVAQVTLEIYNVSGQKVRTLAQGQHEPGRYRIQWNATNDYGNPLSSGMYIYRIHAGDFVSVKKLILMK